MGSTEDAKVLAIVAAAPELGARPTIPTAFLNAMPVGELASLWCALQRLSRRDQTSGAWAAKLYFDHLPHRSRIARSILRLKCCAVNPTSRP